MPRDVSPDAPDALEFPADFLFGCASAPHQVEGGIDNDWSRFERVPGRIKDGSVSGIACDHWTRYRQDLQDLADRGQNAHRFGIEWARIEPREGEFDHAALLHYRDVVLTCRDLGIEPLVTLQHFTLPAWLADRGGVRSPDAPRLFARYTALVAEYLGEGVTWWTTLNEPEVLASMAYVLGEFPPMVRNLRAAFGALRGLLHMHAAATTALRTVAGRHGWDVKVSFAHHERRFRPGSRSPLDRLVTLLPDYVLNRWFLDSAVEGRVLPPVGRGQALPGGAATLDYIGLNYYTEEIVTFDPRMRSTLFARPQTRPDLPRSTFDWAIDPDGLHRALVAMGNRYGLPVLVLENGVADNDDELRPRYIVDHLAAVHRALADGVEVRAYMHWTALDNFEWGQGYSQRFGLFGVDRATMERIPKPSAEVYAAICHAHAIPAAMLDGDPLRALREPLAEVAEVAEVADSA